MDIAWHDFVARQEVLVAMRFSYFGNSGWKSDFSKTKAMLFEKDRLIMRMGLLRSLPLPSLAAQTDQNFHLMVLCSYAMPEWAQTALAELCAEVLPEGKYTVAPRRYGFAHFHLSRFLVERYQTGPAIQTVLDDDDGFSTDLIASIRREMVELPPMADAGDMRFISFCRGYGLDLSRKDPATFALYRHRYPYINLGLTMMADVAGKNLFSIRHRKTPQQHPCRIVEGPPMFVRSVHEANDSRVEVSERWKPIADWRCDPTVIERFPYLPPL